MKREKVLPISDQAFRRVDPNQFVGETPHEKGADCAEQLAPLSIDMKGVTKLTGFGRQRISVFRKDLLLGFPEPLRIGRSLRWLVSDIQQWLQAMKRSNAELLGSLVSEKFSVSLKPSKKAAPPELARPSLMLQKARKYTQAEVEAGNQQAFATRLKPGQSRVSATVVTQEGASVMSYRLMGRPSAEPVSPFTPTQMRRKIVFLPGTSLDVKERFLAAQAALAAPRIPAAPTAKEPICLPLAGVPAKEVLLADLKTYYEGGQNLDTLCKQYGMGKSRLSKLLREAGAQMRQPGRQSQTKQVHLP